MSQDPLHIIFRFIELNHSSLARAESLPIGPRGLKTILESSLLRNKLFGLLFHQNNLQTMFLKINLLEFLEQSICGEKVYLEESCCNMLLQLLLRY